MKRLHFRRPTTFTMPFAHTTSPSPSISSALLLLFLHNALNPFCLWSLMMAGLVSVFIYQDVVALLLSGATWKGLFRVACAKSLHILDSDEVELARRFVLCVVGAMAAIYLLLWIASFLLWHTACFVGRVVVRPCVDGLASFVAFARALCSDLGVAWRSSESWSVAALEGCGSEFLMPGAYVFEETTVEKDNISEDIFDQAAQAGVVLAEGVDDQAAQADAVLVEGVGDQMELAEVELVGAAPFRGEVAEALLVSPQAAPVKKSRLAIELVCLLPSFLLLAF